MKKLIAYDLGTGGIKASLFDENGESLADAFIAYPTFYPHDKWCEQRPMDWWQGVCDSTQMLLQKMGVHPKEIAAAALSGHSIVTAPLDKAGNLLQEQVPIWCDMRPDENETKEFFSNLPYDKWYLTTGNGDPPECYSILKMMWMKKHMPDVYAKTDVVLGSKDFINYMLTGKKYTDPSYASGFGVFNLLKWDYEDAFFKAAGIDRRKFPDIIPSDAVVGTVTAETAARTGLPAGIPVLRAAGWTTPAWRWARAAWEKEKRTPPSVPPAGSPSLPKSPSWTPLPCPLCSPTAQKGYYTSAVSIFSAGNSFRWMRDVSDERCAGRGKVRPHEPNGGLRSSRQQRRAVQPHPGGRQRAGKKPQPPRWIHGAHPWAPRGKTLSAPPWRASPCPCGARWIF